MAVKFHGASTFEPLEPRLFLTILYRIDVIPSPQLATDYLAWIQISDLNDAGEVIGTVEGGRSEVEVQSPFIWTTKDGMRVLSLPDGKRGVAAVLSPSGSILGSFVGNAEGYFQSDGFNFREIQYPENAPLLPSSDVETALFRGRTILAQQPRGPGWRDIPSDIVTMTGSVSRSFGVPGEVQVADVNNSGVVLTQYGPAYGPSVLDGSILRHIQELIVNPSGWRIDEGLAINNLGQIVGTGLHNGNREGFILTPVSETAEPLPIGPNDVAVVWDPPPGWHWSPPDQQDDQTVDSSADDNASGGATDSEVDDEEVVISVDNSPGPNLFAFGTDESEAVDDDLLSSSDPVASMTSMSDPLQ